MAKCRETIVVDDKLHECDLKEQHDPPHEEVSYDAEREAFITFEWFSQDAR
jgi:hypothetical protein